MLKTWLIILVVIFAAAMCSGVVWIIELPFALAFGWVFYLWRTIPDVTWDWPAIASGLTFLLLSIAGFHLVARSIAASREGAWRWSWSVRICILVIVIFGVSIAFGGIAHQVGWLASTKQWMGLSVGSGRITRDIANARQLIIGLRLYAADQGGSYPAHLDALLPAGSLEGLENYEKMSVFVGDSTAPPTPWVYVHGFSDSAPGSLPIIIAPHAIRGGRRIIGTNDTSVELMNAKYIRQQLPSWKEAYAALGIPLPHVLQEYDTPPAQ